MLSYSHRILLVFSWYSLGVSPLRSRRAFGGPVAPPPSRYLDLTAPVRPLSRWNAGSAPPTDGRVKIQPSQGSRATAGLAFSSPRLGRTATISRALVAGAGAHISEGTFERIPL